MRVVDIREKSIPISRYADPRLPSGGLTTSVVALVTDCVRQGKPVTGYGFSSIGRYAQGGLIRERFAPRLIGASEKDLMNPERTNLDPFRAWDVMMKGEKSGGHGERCVAVGTLDMAIWDAASKIAQLPLHRFLRERFQARQVEPSPVKLYAGGGYPYPTNDIALLSDELNRFRDSGYVSAKIKIGAASLSADLNRIDAALKIFPADHLAVDAMNFYGAAESVAAATALAPYGLWWFEDICDPLDFETLAAIARIYAPPIAAGEALFSAAEATLLALHGGLRPARDILVFDPVHCYGVPGYLRLIDHLEQRGWSRSAFWPHGGHIFCLHLASGLGLGGAEVNPAAFFPVAGLADGIAPMHGAALPPEIPGIGFELLAGFRRVLADL